jgi:hypothetical protein
MAKGMNTKEILDRIRQDMSAGLIKIVVADGHRYYTDTLTETLHIPLTTPDETAQLYKRYVIDVDQTQQAQTKDLFATLPRVSMFIGQPDTGKTYAALDIAKQCGIEPIFIMARDNLNLETLLEDFTLVDGKPVFNESLAVKALSDPNKERAIIIIDEFNTLMTGTAKSFQPIMDDTSTTFVYRGKIYEKNMNCKFIVTLNEKDKGISILPDAILSRSYLKTFEPTSPQTLAKWTGTDEKWVTALFNVYKALGLLSVFGTRQIRMLKPLGDLNLIENHLRSLCVMKNIDSKLVDSLEVKTLIHKL